MIEGLHFTISIERRQISSDSIFDVVALVEIHVAWQRGWQEYAEGIRVFSYVYSHIELGQHKLLSIGFFGLLVVSTNFAVLLTPMHALTPDDANI